jgi:hypothetical protein
MEGLELELEQERKVTILDEYNCVVMADRLRISIDSARDPSLTDIMSELYGSDGHMYFDGSYYIHNGDYRIDLGETGWYLDLFII